MLVPWKKYDHKNMKRYCLTVYKQIKRYCTNPKSKFYYFYGGKGAQCHFTSAREIEYLYKRDQVELMTEPSFIVRENRKHFNRINCRFIDQEERFELFKKKYLKVMQKEEEKLASKRLQPPQTVSENKIKYA